MRVNMTKSFSLKTFQILATSVISSILMMAPVYAKDTLNPGESLTPGQSLSSANGCYIFVLQTDGNLVLYKTRPQQKALWSSKTGGLAVSHAPMQLDGNLVIYALNGKALWSSGTHDRDGSHLALQNDGNLVIYTPANRAVWSTKTGNQFCE